MVRDKTDWTTHSRIAEDTVEVEDARKDGSWGPGKDILRSRE